MKKKVLIIIVILIVAIVSIIFFFSSKNEEVENPIFTKATEESRKIKDSNRRDFNKITVFDYLNFLENKDKVIILVGRDDCEYCQIATPIIQNIMYKNDIDVYYISTDDFTIETEDLFMTSDERLNTFATPLLLSLENGEIIDGVQGLRETKTYNSFFKENGYIE